MSSAAGSAAAIVNFVREDEKARRLQTEALGRFNYLRQIIAEKKSHPTTHNEDLNQFTNEVLDIDEKDAELHLLTTPHMIAYYYYEHQTTSWLFLERDRVNGSSTMYATHRAGKDAVPLIQMLVH